MYLSLFSQPPQLLQLSVPLYMYKSIYSLQPLQLSQPSVLVDVSLLIATSGNNSTVCACAKLSSTRNPYLLQPSCIIVRVQVNLVSATRATVFVRVRKKSLSTLDATNATIPTSCPCTSLLTSRKKWTVSAQVSTSRNNCNYYNQASEYFHLKHSNQFFQYFF